MDLKQYVLAGNFRFGISGCPRLMWIVWSLIGLARVATGQTPTIPTTIPCAGIVQPNQTVVLQRMTLGLMGWNCEAVSQDPTTSFRRDGTGRLFISAIPGQPPVNYSVVFNAEFKGSNTVEPAAIPGTLFNGVPASNWDGQAVWCLNRAQTVNNAVLNATQISTLLPVQMIEVRQGTGSSIVTSANLAWPSNARWKYNSQHGNCQGTPGITFSKGADLIGQDGSGNSAPLLQLWVVSLVSS